MTQAVHHQLHGPSDHKDSYSSDSCQACQLSLCKVCGGAEASMPTDCPGERMSADRADEVQAGKIDFVDGHWVDLS